MENEIEKKKSNKKLIIIIVVLIVGLLGLSTYVVYDKCFKKEKEPEVVKKKPAKEDEKEKEQVLTITDTVKEKLLKQIDDYLELADSFPINDVDDLDDQAIFLFVISHIPTGNLNSFNREAVVKVLNEYFKANINIVYGDINCFAGDGILYKYNATTEEYNFFGTHGHGGYGLPSGKVYYLSSEVKGDKYIIKVNVLYRDYCSDTCGPTTAYYKNASDAQNYTNPVFIPSQEGESLTDGEYQSIKDTLPVTVFKFIKTGDNYGLESVKTE